MASFVFNFCLREFLLSADANRFELRCEPKRRMLLYYKICPCYVIYYGILYDIVDARFCSRFKFSCQNLVCLQFVMLAVFVIDVKKEYFKDMNALLSHENISLSRFFISS